MQVHQTIKCLLSAFTVKKQQQQPRYFYSKPITPPLTPASLEFPKTSQDGIHNTTDPFISKRVYIYIYIV